MKTEKYHVVLERPEGIVVKSSSTLEQAELSCNTRDCNCIGVFYGVRLRLGVKLLGPQKIGYTENLNGDYDKDDFEKDVFLEEEEDDLEDVDEDRKLLDETVAVLDDILGNEDEDEDEDEKEDQDEDEKEDGKEDEESPEVIDRGYTELVSNSKVAKPASTTNPISPSRTVRIKTKKL